MLKEVEDYLESRGIKYINHHHEPVFTSKVANQVCKDIPGIHCKNLFMKDKKTNDLYLYTLPSKERADLKELAKKVGVKHFSMCNSDILMQVLCVEPGHVSPLTLIHESAKEVTWLINKKVFEADLVGFHPNENNQTLEIKKEDFHKLVESFSQKKVLI